MHKVHQICIGSLYKETKGKKKAKAQSDIVCKHCDRPGHSQPDCYLKGGGKEGQAPWQTKKSKPKQQEAVIVAIDKENNELLVFTCTLNYVAVANELDVPKSKLGMCIDSRASRDYHPHQSKFVTYRSVKCKITIADGQMLNMIRMGDLQLELPNSSGKTVMSMHGFYPQKSH